MYGDRYSKNQQPSLTQEKRLPTGAEHTEPKLTFERIPHLSDTLRRVASVEIENLKQADFALHETGGNVDNAITEFLTTSNLIIERMLRDTEWLWSDSFLSLYKEFFVKGAPQKADYTSENEKQYQYDYALWCVKRKFFIVTVGYTIRHPEFQKQLFCDSSHEHGGSLDWHLAIDTKIGFEPVREIRAHNYSVIHHAGSIWGWEDMNDEDIIAYMEGVQWLQLTLNFGPYRRDKKGNSDPKPLRNVGYCESLDRYTFFGYNIIIIPPNIALGRDEPMILVPGNINRIGMHTRDGINEQSIGINFAANCNDAPPDEGSLELGAQVLAWLHTYVGADSFGNSNKDLARISAHFEFFISNDDMLRFDRNCPGDLAVRQYLDPAQTPWYVAMQIRAKQIILDTSVYLNKPFKDLFADQLYSESPNK